jgi:hypothetical protein
MRYKAAREAVGDDSGAGQGKPSGSDEPQTTEDGQPLRKDVRLEPCQSRAGLTLGRAMQGQPDERFSGNHGFAADPEEASRQ